MTFAQEQNLDKKIINKELLRIEENIYRHSKEHKYKL